MISSQSVWCVVFSDLLWPVPKISDTGCVSKAYTDLFVFSKLRNVMSYLVMETPGDIWHMAVKYWHIFACIYNDVTRAIFFCILFKEAILGWAGCQAKVSVFWAVYKTQQSTSSYFAPLINHNCQDSGKSGAFAHSNAWQECSLVEQIEKCMTQRSRVFGQMNCVKWHPH